MRDKILIIAVTLALPLLALGCAPDSREEAGAAEAAAAPAADTTAGEAIATQDFESGIVEDAGGEGAAQPEGVTDAGSDEQP